MNNEQLVLTCTTFNTPLNIALCKKLKANEVERIEQEEQKKMKAKNAFVEI